MILADTIGSDDSVRVTKDKGVGYIPQLVSILTPGCLCGSDLETLLPAAQCLPVAVQKLVCIARRVWHYTLYAYQKHLTRRIPFRPHCV